MKFVDPKLVYSNSAHGRRGLPAWTYNQPELTELEFAEIFRKTWLWVCHVSDIPNPGDFETFELADERAIVIRGDDGVVRSFHNLCRHRASKVVAGERGSCEHALVCPFHGWAYHFDGRLKTIPRHNTFPIIDRSSMGLKPIECEVWHGMVFIRFSGDGPSVAETFAEAEEELSLYRIGEMNPFDDAWRMDFDLDWKSLVDIDSEGYHVPIGHPDLFDLVGASYLDQVTVGGVTRSHCTVDGGSHKSEINRRYVESLPRESYLPDSHSRQWIYWGSFPGFVITLFPDQVEIYQSYPTGYQTSVMAGRSYALADDRPEMQRARECNREINMVVGNEDVELIEWAAAGMRSSAFDGAVMSDLEVGVVAFQNQLCQKIPVVQEEAPPAAGMFAQKNSEMLKHAAA
ncbi:MAG: aromatic ring-hydroxylating dioxygenase subunit alpha [Pseudomonadota bacterium]